MEFEPTIIEQGTISHDGILETTQYLYYGDGIYAEYKPEIISPEEGEAGDTDNTVFEGQQKDNTSRPN